MPSWPTVRRRRRGDSTDYCVDLGKVPDVGTDGKIVKRRKTYFRKTKVEAESLAAKLRAERERFGAVLLGISDYQVADAIRAISLLGGEYSLEHIVKSFLEGRERAQNAPGLGRVCDDYLRELRDRVARSEVSQRHLNTAGSILDKLSRVLADAKMRDVDAARIRTYLDEECNGNATTRANHLRYIRLLFGYARQMGYTEKDVSRDVPMPRVKRRAPGYLSVTDVAALLGCAKAEEQWGMEAYLVMGFYAGLRAQELSRLRGFQNRGPDVWLGPAVTKTGRSRQVPNPYHRRVGIPNIFLPRSTEFDKWRRGACEHLGIKWPHNAMRHTFATYHMAHYENPPLTAKILGHKGSMQLLYNHYAAQGVTKEEAAKYWEICP